MTVEKKQITIPAWMFNGILTLLGLAFAYYAAMASIGTKLERATIDIETLRQEKVSRDEFKLVLEKLNSIDAKLDSHIDK